MNHALPNLAAPSPGALEAVGVGLVIHDLLVDFFL